MSAGKAQAMKGAGRRQGSKAAAIPATKRRAAKPAAPIAKKKPAAKPAAAPAKKRPVAKPAAMPAKKPRTSRPAAPDAKTRRTATTLRAANAAVPVPRTLDEFMSQALVMEIEAAQRYAEFADAMETHNNLEVAALFRKMATIEGKHAQQIMDGMGWTTLPGPRPGLLFREGFEAPETTPGDEVHYLMQPYHALELALANELRAERFFAQLARAATTDAVRKAARELQAEEREHVLLVRAWMKKVPKPDADWAIDPDPPEYIE
jgi:rubrerythrin